MTSAALAQQVEPSPSPLTTTLAPVAPVVEEIAVARAEPVGERELAVKLQIFLDQQNFGPGKIDGRPKEFTLKALGRYEKAHGLPISTTLEQGGQLPLSSINPIYTYHTISPEDVKRIGDVPRKPELQAKLANIVLRQTF